MKAEEVRTIKDQALRQIWDTEIIDFMNQLEKGEIEVIDNDIVLAEMREILDL